MTPDLLLLPQLGDEVVAVFDRGSSRCYELEMVVRVDRWGSEVVQVGDEREAKLLR